MYVFNAACLSWYDMLKVVSKLLRKITMLSINFIVVYLYGDVFKGDSLAAATATTK